MLKGKHMERVVMTDVEDVSVVLAIEIYRNHTDGTLTISQAHHVKYLLERYGMAECNLPGSVHSWTGDGAAA